MLLPAVSWLVKTLSFFLLLDFFMLYYTYLCCVLNLRIIFISLVVCARVLFSCCDAISNVSFCNCSQVKRRSSRLHMRSHILAQYICIITVKDHDPKTQIILNENIKDAFVLTYFVFSWWRVLLDVIKNVLDPSKFLGNFKLSSPMLRKFVISIWLIRN